MNHVREHSRLDSWDGSSRTMSKCRKYLRTVLVFFQASGVCPFSSVFSTFIDHGTETSFSYDAEFGEIARRIEQSHEKEGFTKTEEVFESLCRGDGPSRSAWFPDAELVGSSTARIIESGQEIVEYSQTIKIPPGNSTVNVSFHVDPASNRPTRMIVEAMAKKEEGDKIDTKTVFAFDYPAEGPADIYALGVPSSARRINEVPSSELKQVVDAAISASQFRTL